MLVPHLDVQSLERGDPELAGAPLVVCEGRDVIDLSPAARKLGLRPGMTIFQARSAAPEAVYRARSPELIRSAEGALVDLGQSFSPRVEQSAGAICVDVSDLGRLFDDEAQIANALFVGARKLGLAVRVGIAADKTTARVAARAGEVVVVPPGREPPFLAPLPVELLEPSPETLETFRRWGVHTIGELEALPAGGVAVRLGAEGALLARVARGQADSPLTPCAEPLVFEEAIDFDWPVENVEPLLFVLRRMLDNLVARLACRALASGDLGITMKLSPRGRDVRTVPVAAPTRDVATLLSLVRLALETSPPANAVEGLVVRTAPARTRSAQLSFFEPAGPSPDKLASTIARLAALVGETRVGAPVMLDRHLPDAFTMQPFNAPRVKLTADSSQLTVAGDARALALHSLRPPVQADARLDRGELRYLAGQGIGGQVLAAAGPFRVRDGWWQLPVTRDYYDVHLSDGAIYRVFHDLHGDSWHIDGCYE
ncbi:MAG: polymerase IV-like protein ImuB [Myxococcales bacterium]|nr:polymerase IV-like protein ImuB [Myxococcales bacterium]